MVPHDKEWRYLMHGDRLGMLDVAELPGVSISDSVQQALIEAPATCTSPNLPILWVLALFVILDQSYHLSVFKKKTPITGGDPRQYYDLEEAGDFSPVGNTGSDQYIITMSPYLHSILTEMPIHGDTHNVVVSEVGTRCGMWLFNHANDPPSREWLKELVKKLLFLAVEAAKKYTAELPYEHNPATVHSMKWTSLIYRQVVVRNGDDLHTGVLLFWCDSCTHSNHLELHIKREERPPVIIVYINFQTIYGGLHSFSIQLQEDDDEDNYVKCDGDDGLIVSWQDFGSSRLASR